MTIRKRFPPIPAISLLLSLKKKKSIQALLISRVNHMSNAFIKIKYIRS